jgi:perosamine synthetase
MTTSVESEILDVLRTVVGTALKPVPLHAPEFAQGERALVMDCIDSSLVSSVGKYVDQFEAALAEFTGARRAVAVVNGTAALEVALSVAGVRAGDEVIVPALSFVATANAVAHCGAIPHFVDSDANTLGIDPLALEDYLGSIGEVSSGSLRNRVSGRRIAAVVPMHTFGHPVDMVKLMAVAGRFHLPVVEDAAESLGSYIADRHTGTLGLMGVLSFNGNKIVTTGGGGAILTNDHALADRLKHLTTTAKRPHRWEFFHDEVAWNFRMPNLNAALGCAQLERLPDFLARKRVLAGRYAAATVGCSGFSFMTEPAGTKSNYWLNTIRLNEPDRSARDRVLAATNDAGYQCRPVWSLLSGLTMYADSPRGELLVAQRLENSLINLPSSPVLAKSGVAS